MANVVDFVIKMQDFASSPLLKIANTGYAAFGKLQESVEKITG